MIRIDDILDKNNNHIPPNLNFNPSNQKQGLCNTPCETFLQKKTNSWKVNVAAQLI